MCPSGRTSTAPPRRTPARSGSPAERDTSRGRATARSRPVTARVVGLPEEQEVVRGFLQASRGRGTARPDVAPRASALAAPAYSPTIGTLRRRRRPASRELVPALRPRPANRMASVSPSVPTRWRRRPPRAGGLRPAERDDPPQTAPRRSSPRARDEHGRAERARASRRGSGRRACRSSSPRRRTGSRDVRRRPAESAGLRPAARRSRRCIRNGDAQATSSTRTASLARR